MWLCVRRWRCWLVAVGLLLAACLPQGVSLPQSPLLASLERKSGRIAYVGVDGNIHVTDQAASEDLLLTEDASLEAEAGSLRAYNLPTWSPGSDRLAFIRTEVAEGNRVTTALVVAPAEGGDLVELYRSQLHHPFYLYWSPEGERLAFLTRSSDGAVLALWVADLETAQAQAVETGQPFYWAWAPTGRDLLLHVGGSARENPEEARVAWLSLDGPTREFFLDVKPGSFQAPALSPQTGLMALVAEGEDGVRSLVLADPEGEVRSTVARVDGRAAFAWAPTGDRLAYVAFDPAGPALAGALHLVSVEGEEAGEPGEPLAESVAAFFWSPDGRRLAYFEPIVVPSQGEDTDPETQQGSEVVLLRLHVLDAGSGASREIATFQPSLSFLNLIPFFDQYQRSATIWSPDGNYIVLSGVSPRGPGVFIVPSSGAFEPRFIARGTLAFWSWK